MRLRRTLRFCAVLFPLSLVCYYFCYRWLWKAEASYALATALTYAVVNVVIFGGLHFVFAGRNR